MKLEVGKKYVLRKGDTVGPIERRGDGWYPFEYRHLTWTGYGQYAISCDSHPYDIVGEFVPAMPAIKEAAENPVDREQGELQLIRNAFNTHFPEWNLFNEQKSDVMAMVEYLASLKRTIVSLGERLDMCQDGFQPASKETCIEIVEKIARVIVDTAEQWKRESKS